MTQLAKTKLHNLHMLKGDILMSEVHNNDIRELLDTIPVIPNELMEEYLVRQYNITPNKAREIIYTILTRREMMILRHRIREIDPEAFINVIDSREILGKGFKSLDAE